MQAVQKNKFAFLASYAKEQAIYLGITWSFPQPALFCLESCSYKTTLNTIHMVFQNNIILIILFLYYIIL